ncbi:MAG: O-antigen ligase family protein [Elusimicrobia bacterium]|nr:O-antigen ligase family protein [Elusimicrobiota bacterium]
MNVLTYSFAAILSIAPLLGGIWNLEVQTLFQVSALFFFCFYIGSKLYSQKLPAFFLDNKNQILILLIVLSAISLTLSPIKNLIAGEWINLAIGFLIIILSRGLTEEQEEKIFKFIFVSAYIICILAFCEILFKRQLPPSSTLINSNALALFSIMIIPFALSMRKYALSTILFIVLLLTASLAGFIAFTIVLLFYLAKTYGIKNKKFVIPCFAIGLIAVLYGFIGLDFKSVADRLIWWRDGFKIVVDKAVLGFGYGSFSFVYPAYHKSVMGGISSLYAHNYFLEFLVENGIISSIIWFAFLVSSFIKGRPIIKYSILAVLLHSFVDFGLSLPFNLWLFCFIVGINNKPTKSDKYEKPAYGKLYALILLCLFITSMQYGYKRLRLNGIYKEIIKVSSAGDFKTSLVLLDRAIIIDKSNPLIYKLKGNLYLNAAREKKDERLFFEAATAFEEALLFNPYDKIVYKRLLEIYEYVAVTILIEDIKLRRAEFMR